METDIINFFFTLYLASDIYDFDMYNLQKCRAELPILKIRCLKRTIFKRTAISRCHFFSTLLCLPPFAGCPTNQLTSSVYFNYSPIVPFVPLWAQAFGTVTFDAKNTIVNTVHLWQPLLYELPLFYNSNKSLLYNN